MVRLLAVHLGLELKLSPRHPRAQAPTRYVHASRVHDESTILVPKCRVSGHTVAFAARKFPAEAGHVHVRERSLSLARDVLLALRFRQTAGDGARAEAAQEG